jgi:hypothetical protein
MKKFLLIGFVMANVMLMAQTPEAPVQAPSSPMKEYYKPNISAATPKNQITPLKWDILFGIVDSQKADIGRLASKMDTGLVAKRVYYVDRQWNTASERQSQNAKARVGDPFRPFAEPWSARNAAILAGGEPTVFIQAGNVFTNADFFPSEHNRTVSIAGTNYVAGIELAYHGITYRFDGSTIETPLMSPSFLSAQAQNGLAVKKAVFFGGKFTDAGSNSSAQSNIHFFVEDGSGSPSRHADRIFTGDVGVKTLVAQTMNRGVMVGDKWWGAPDAGNSSVTREYLRYAIERVRPHATGSVVAALKIHNKDVLVNIGSAKFNRTILDIGHWSGASNDGTLGGIENSRVTIKIGNIEKTDYAYTADVGGGLINTPNNRNSRITVEMPGLDTITVPKFLWIYGIQEGNIYSYRFSGKTFLNNPVSTESPMLIGLGTSTATISGDFDSNVNSDFISVSSGTLHLKGRYVQRAAGKTVVGIAPGAKVICDCELVSADGVTPVVTGTGTFISLNARANVAPAQTVSTVGQVNISSGYNY